MGGEERGEGGSGGGIAVATPLALVPTRAPLQTTTRLNAPASKRPSPITHTPPLNTHPSTPDEIDAIGTKRYDSHSGGEREIQRTMLGA